MGLAGFRILLLFSAALVTAALVSVATGAPFSPSLTTQLSALYFIPVNMVCLVLLRRRLRARGSTLAALTGFDRANLARDVWQGLLWLFALFVPFVIVVNLVMLVMFGTQGMFAAFETVFTPDGALFVEFAPWFAWASALLTAVLFPLTNAPAEELVYRGHAQGELFKAGRPAWLAVGLPAAAFGAQHVLLAPSPTGMVVFGCAFFAWGLGAGLIYRLQGRLMPVIVAHFVTNLMFAVAPVILLLVMG